jgi:hypothetical protein
MVIMWKQIYYTRQYISLKLNGIHIFIIHILKNLNILLKYNFINDIDSIN